MLTRAALVVSHTEQGGDHAEDDAQQQRQHRDLQRPAQTGDIQLPPPVGDEALIKVLRKGGVGKPGRRDHT